MTAPGPVHVTSLFEAHLPVSDVARAVRFYRDVVGLEVAYDDAERGVVFLWAGQAGGALRRPSRRQACSRSRSSASRPRSRA